MINAYLPEAVKASERTAIAQGDDSFSMIHRAAQAVLDYIFENKLDTTRVFILAGYGNNGSDGILLGKMLLDLGIKVDIFRVDSPICCRENLYYSEQISLLNCFPPTLEEYTLIVDALYGIGFHGSPTTVDQQMIEAINESSVTVLSIDIPSGVNGLDGSCSLAIKADHTCAISCLKVGHLVFPGAEQCGIIKVLDCGIPLPKNAGATCLTHRDLSFLPQRKRRSNKGCFGKIAVIAGSKGMAGASYFAAKAALLSGAGLVELFCPEENRVILQTLLPEAILRVYDGHTNLTQLIGEVSKCDAMILGPGLGRDHMAEQLVKMALKELSIPAVVDADGLNLSCKTNLLERYKGQLVITPHPGEASRILDIPIQEILDRMLYCCTLLSEKCSATALLKDAHTLIVTEGRLNVNLSGNDGMATAGSGDLLTGIIATLLAQGFPAHDAAAMGAFVHGLAGDLAAKKHGKRSLTASRIAEHIEDVFKLSDQPSLINSMEEM